MGRIMAAMLPLMTKGGDCWGVVIYGKARANHDQNIACERPTCLDVWWKRKWKATIAKIQEDLIFHTRIEATFVG